MTGLHFYKYQGTGNDFVLLNGFEEGIEDPSPTYITFLCDRHFGIGSDGLILLRPDEEWDMEMRFFNPDGSQSFCGNGSRCAVRAFFELGLADTEQKSVRFRAIDGVHEGKMLEDGNLEVSVGNVGKLLEMEDHYFIDNGSPHVLRMTDDIDEADLEAVAASYRKGYEERGGTNLNLLHLEEKGALSMRTFERGVNAETLSCGSGVTAAALLASHLGYAEHECRVETRGGSLWVRFEREGDGFRNIRLIGPAAFVFEGNLAGS